MNVSRFFIDRPIAAIVLSAPDRDRGSAQSERPAPHRIPPGHAPHRGGARLLLRRQSTGDRGNRGGASRAGDQRHQGTQAAGNGALTLTVTFEASVDPDLAQVQVQNRVPRAVPRLPQEVQRIGITSQKAAPGILMVVHLLSPGERYDPLYLSNYATLRIKDELARIPGVGAALVFGAGDYSLRVWLDPNRTRAPAHSRFPQRCGRRWTAWPALFPEGVEHRIVYDPTIFVRASIRNVALTLVEATGLVVLVVLLFLQTWRASFIPVVAVPVSLVGTFAVMHLFGLTLNTLSLFGLVLSIGIVVDDAIVVVENIERHIARGRGGREAAMAAMEEVTGRAPSSPSPRCCARCSSPPRSWTVCRVSTVRPDHRDLHRVVRHQLADSLSRPDLIDAEVARGPEGWVDPAPGSHGGTSHPSLQRLLRQSLDRLCLRGGPGP